MNNLDLFDPELTHEMRVVTLTEPWATMMRLRAKRLETRGGTFPRRYRGPCAIQAAKSFPMECRALCAEEPFYSILRERLGPEIGIEFEDDPTMSRSEIHRHLFPTLGHVIALGVITESYSTTHLMMQNAVLMRDMPTRPATIRLKPQPIEQALGNYDADRVVLEFQWVRGLRKPVSVMGSLGLWRPRPEISERIRKEAPEFEETLVASSRIASGLSICQLCKRIYVDHPYEMEVLSDQGRPYLVRACNGLPLML